MAKYRSYDISQPIDWWFAVLLHIEKPYWHPLYDVHIFGYSIGWELPPGSQLWQWQPSEPLAEACARDLFAAHYIADELCGPCIDYDYRPRKARWNLYRGVQRSRRYPWPTYTLTPYPIPYWAGRIIYWPDWPPIWP